MEHEQQLRVAAFRGTSCNIPVKEENEGVYDHGLVDGKIGSDKDF